MKYRFAAAGLFLLSALTMEQCTPKPDSAQSELKGVVSVKELMESLIDPLSDNIFDAVASDVSLEKGSIDIKPTTDEDWAKVKQGAVMLAEGSNLLKLPRPVAPPGDKNNSEGANAPELSPEAIQAKIDGDRALWNKHADELRAAAMKTLDLVKARNSDALFEMGGELDMVCEGCHLEYWYPGDKKTVLEDAQKHVTITPPKK